MAAQDPMSEIEDDLSLNEINLMRKSLDLPSLQLKYGKKLLSRKGKLRVARDRLDAVRSELLLKYKYKDSYKWDGKELITKIEGDPAFQEAQRELDEAKNYVEFYEGIISTINSMSFTISNFVKLKTFYEGGK